MDGTMMRLTKYDGSTWTVYTPSNSGLPNYLVLSIAIDNNGNKWFGTFTGLAVFQEGGIVEVKDKVYEIPSQFTLRQNYPNPFNPATQISFAIQKANHVTLKVYDILGREVAILVDERKQAGEYKVTWNAEGAPSGVYFYRLVATSVSYPVMTFTQVKKMILLK
jgi:hypothetical protein